MRTQLCAALVLVGLAGVAHAAGFAVDTHGGRATGVATAIVAHANDPSAVFYNPAGILNGDELQLQIGDTAILPVVRYTGDRTQKSTSASAVSPPPHFYATAQLSDNLAAGFGVFTAYGSSSNWPVDWEHRHRSRYSQLATYFLNPEVAYRVHDRVRLGVGFQAVRSSITIERMLGFVDSEGSVRLTGGGWGFGFNAGAQVDVIDDKLTFGLAYRSRAKVNYTGQARFKDIPIEFQQLIKDQDVKATITLPDTAFIGIAYQATPNLIVAADVHYYGWSAFREIAIDFEDPALNQRVPKNWGNAFNYHLGAEFQMSPTFAVRAGAVYDPTPSPMDTLTPELPDANRIKGAVGVGYRRDRFRADLGYQFVLLQPSKSVAPGYEGRYTGTAHVVGFTLGYQP